MDVYIYQGSVPSDPYQGAYPAAYQYQTPAAGYYQGVYPYAYQDPYLGAYQASYQGAYQYPYQYPYQQAPSQSPSQGWYVRFLTGACNEFLTKLLDNARTQGKSGWWQGSWQSSYTRLLTKLTFRLTSGFQECSYTRKMGGCQQQRRPSAEENL